MPLITVEKGTALIKHEGNKKQKLKDSGIYQSTKIVLSEKKSKVIKVGINHLEEMGTSPVIYTDSLGAL